MKSTREQLWWVAISVVASSVIVHGCGGHWWMLIVLTVAFSFALPYIWRIGHENARDKK